MAHKMPVKPKATPMSQTPGRQTITSGAYSAITRSRAS